MTMTATGLPVASSSPTPAAPTASPSAAEGTAAEDFLLMLGQLLGGAASRTAADAASTQSSATEGDAAPAEDVSATALPFPLVIPWLVQQDARAGAAEGSDALESLQSMLASGGGTGAQPDDGLAAALLDMLGKDSQEVPGIALQGTVSATATQDVSSAQRTVPGDVPRALHQPVGSSAWADELGTRLALMTERGHHSASLRLSPEHLGPLEVRIAVRDDQASVWFGAGNADTRAALEQALPRLRELFASQGLSLADAGVFREPPRDPPKFAAASSGGSEGSVSEIDALPQASLVRLGLVDAYA